MIKTAYREIFPEKNHSFIKIAPCLNFFSENWRAEKDVCGHTFANG